MTRYIKVQIAFALEMGVNLMGASDTAGYCLYCEGRNALNAETAPGAEIILADVFTFLCHSFIIIGAKRP